MIRRAFVRPPGKSFATAISSSGASIDVVLAASQHREYCQALAAAGVEVTHLPADERFPDSCFMQDPALVLDGRAIICRLAAPSRQGEEEAVARLLAPIYPLTRIASPGTLEGGDVLVLPDRVLVGLSDRTNSDGVAQLAHAISRPVKGIPVDNLLHLLSGITYLGRQVLLATEALAGLPDLQGHEVLVVPQSEAYACNALAVGDRVVFPAGYPHTAALLRTAGFQVLETPVSEFAKADGGVTCLSLFH